MKKLVLAATVATALLSANAMADVTASATASWDAHATKDTTSVLVVTPLKSLNFQYAQGTENFNSQSGAFDVTIEGQSGASDFKLTSQLVSNTLTRGTDDSTLEVGVAWNGTKLTESAETSLVDTSQNISSGLSTLAVSDAYQGTTATPRTSAQGIFDFTIDSATSDGSTGTSFSELADGYWSGDVKVQFTAVWTVADESITPAA